MYVVNCDYSENLIAMNNLVSCIIWKYMVLKDILYLLLIKHVKKYVRLEGIETWNVACVCPLMLLYSVYSALCDKVI